VKWRNLHSNIKTVEKIKKIATIYKEGKEIW